MIKYSRMFISLLIMTVLILIIAGRLFWIQILGMTHFTSEDMDLIASSVRQREKRLTLDTGRGDFYDRNGEALTGSWISAAAYFPLKEKGGHEQENAVKIAGILGITPEQWKQFIAGKGGPRFWTMPGTKIPYRLSGEQISKIEELQLASVKVLPYRLRYPSTYVGRQLIGFVSHIPEQNQAKIKIGEIDANRLIGASGLEKTFDSLIQGVAERSVAYFLGGDQKPLSGLDIRSIASENRFYPLKVMTTVNSAIQSQIEKALDDRHILKGSVVVLDARNADVVAMASRPQFDPYQVDPKLGAWHNHALQAIEPGSVFKTVVAAAALEYRVVDPQELFFCNGELGKFDLSCWKKGGHGALTLKQAYAESCNVTFAKIMERLTPEQLGATARKLGLTERVGWSDNTDFHQFDHEEPGQLFASSTNSHDPGVLAQTAIGQRDVRVTPLQSANMVVTLLNEGLVQSPRVVSKIVYRNDRTKQAFKPHAIRDQDRLSQRTCEFMQEAMRQVVEEGTGQALRDSAWPIAGKSGTAQTKGTAGNSFEHQWFVGYAPAETPRYVVNVVVEDTEIGSPNQSQLLFKQIVQILSGT